MARYGLFFRADTNKPLNLYIYRENELPPVETWPKDGSYLVTFDDTHQDYNMLYGVFVEDQDREYSGYDGPNAVYDRATNTITVPQLPVVTVIDQIRIERNRRIAWTDEIMFAPDLPANIKQELLDYRQALRDITKNLPPGADLHTAPWPEIPNKFVTVNPDHLSGDHNPI